MIPTALEGKSFRWLLECASDAMFVADREGHILLANVPMARLFGYTGEELAALTIEDLIPERFRRAHQVRRADYSATPGRRRMGSGLELYGRRKDGSEFPVDVSLSPLDTGADALTLATVHDISPRRQAEEALAREDLLLRENEARIRAIVETAVDSIITINEQGIVDTMNPAAERLFGYRAAEVIGRNVSLLMPAPYREQHDGYLARYLATGEKKIIGLGREVRGLRKDGTTFPMELAVAEMRVGERRMFTGMVRDISERKRVEERQARLVQELESANEELKNFAYVVSHDLKAPLRAIGSLADWIATDNADKFDAEGREHLRLLLGRVRRMDSLIDGILQYSRVGRLKETRLAVDLNELVREVIDLLHPPENIAVHIDNTLPTMVAERTRLQQVFQNLLSNAIKYLDKPRGEIHVGSTSENGVWRFHVSDNGPGIETRHFDRVFQLFQTLAPRDRVESTGVGLALVKKIVEMYGGRIWLESTVGQGSTFHFTLPRATAGVSTQIEEAS
jgi:two-component system sensor kinase FixL